ncbi:MAG TPA: hypothetical protein VJ579_04435 [Candidatus Paceibacterota bacterium]|nr:hypothetical protein [Candidatus Paceibacterota bacterium]
MDGKLFHWGTAGKITVATGIFALLTLIAVSTVGVFSMQASAGGTGAATSTVKVLNTPPRFNAAPREVVISATTTPTLNGSVVVWSADAYDSSSNNIYLLICRTNGAPTATTSAQPVCAGGAGNNLAVTSGTPPAPVYPATAIVYATSSPITDNVNETIQWYAFVCDDVVGLPKCSKVTDPLIQGALPNPEASPLVINHPHTFSLITNNGPRDPGQAITFTASSTEVTHQDTINGPDLATLFLCKAPDFTGSDCGPGGKWASSTVAVQTNPTAGWTFTIPMVNGATTTYPYILDSRQQQAIGAAQGSSTTFTVNNVAPTIVPGTIALIDQFASTSLKLVVEKGETPNFKLSFQVQDNNSCKTAAGGNQASSTAITVYRSGYADASCNGLANGQHNYNSCYSSADASATWNVTCAPDPTYMSDTCAGTGDTTVAWSCSFPLWYTTDPTDFGSPWSGEQMKVNIIPMDSSGATTSNLRLTGSEMNILSALGLTANTFSFGGWEPGQGNTNLGVDDLGATTSLLQIQATGNASLDTNISGTDMCVGYPACSGLPGDTIPAGQERYATSTVLYASGITLATTTPKFFDFNILKSTSTSTPSMGTLYWGITVPAAITVSGDYKGQNAIDAVVNASAIW